MDKTNAYLSVLLAGLLVAAGVQAQSASASGSTDLPPKAGEASTQTQGVPNVQTTNSPVGEAPVSTKDQIRQSAQVPGGAAPTSSVPIDAGEESTVVAGQPNIDPNQPRAKSRAEVVNELMMRRSQLQAARAAQIMGNVGYEAPVGVSQTLPPDSPSVFEGGTPQ